MNILPTEVTASFDYLYPFLRSVIKGADIPGLFAVKNAFYKIEGKDIQDVLYLWCKATPDGLQFVVDEIAECISYWKIKEKENEYIIAFSLPEGVTQAFEEGTLDVIYEQYKDLCNHQSDSTYSAVVANRVEDLCAKVKRAYLAKKLDMKTEDIDVSAIDMSTLHIKPVHSPYLEAIPGEILD